MTSRILTAPDLRHLREKLRQRHALLKELATLNLKRLAGEFGVSYMTVRRHEKALYGRHEADPDARIECETSITRCT